MKRKTLVIIASVVLSISVLLVAGYYFLMRTNRVPKFVSLFPNATATPTPTPTEPPFSLGKFIILPATFAFSTDDVTFLKTQGYKSILYETIDAALLAKAKALIPEVTIYSFGAESELPEIRKCQNRDLASGTDSANISEIFSFFISKEPCSTNTKLSNLTMNDCNLSDNNCLLFIQQNLHKNAYLYIPKSPYITSFSTPSLAADMNHGFPVIQWPTNYPNTKVSQSSYSLEIKDYKTNRLFASGRIGQTNQGDYIIPTADWPTQPLTATLRIWYSLDGKVTTTP